MTWSSRTIVEKVELGNSVARSSSSISASYYRVSRQLYRVLDGLSLKHFDEIQATRAFMTCTAATNIICHVVQGIVQGLPERTKEVEMNIMVNSIKRHTDIKQGH